MATVDVRAVIRQFYFLLSILLVIALAELFPWLGSFEGPLHTTITVKYIAVSIIFFASGVSVKNSDILVAIKQCKLHIFIQSFSFLITPIVVRLALFIFIFPFGLDNWIITGIIAVSCMPPAVSSAVILTKTAKGNVLAAIFNSAIGSFLGVFLTPALLLIHVGFSSTLPLRDVVVSLVGTVCMPIFVGQAIQAAVGRPLNRMTSVSEYSLLFIIYCSFCDMFYQKEFTIDPHHILVTLVIVLGIQLMLINISLVALSAFKKSTFHVEDIIAIIFCCTHKSLTLGFPLLKTMYGGYSHLSQISLPLLMYHSVQLILGSLLSPYAAIWLRKNFKCKRLQNMP